MRRNSSMDMRTDRTSSPPDTQTLWAVPIPPSVSLMINRDGSPECRAVGGNPAADISWIPESDNVTTRSRMEPDNTWTVISTYSEHGISGREVKCNVSHPAFTHPQIMSVLIPDVVVSVVAGSVGILHCAHDPGDTFIMSTWYVLPLYKALCYMSMTDNNTFNNCTERAKQDKMTLKILDTEITDTGEYTCEVINAEGTFKNNILLQVLVPPSVSLMINRDGSPECRAVGGNPAADISWIPESDNVTTRRGMESDNTWTVISTYSEHGISGRDVKCNVSHPAFTHPQIMSVLIPGGALAMFPRSWCSSEVSAQLLGGPGGQCLAA
ncbi:cell surface glyco CD200 receptor 1-A-like [Pelobates cultripes]|uniref:Cell surface glyco CD200 receptor 1-A-like n=1 Tax=Pelobates cultripes TaxID=61616 RepID=A0AAD1VI06_PELCU|nr:cell surface glyco CD200 receptor 1-A-like [Pelobates cultripes]